MQRKSESSAVFITGIGSILPGAEFTDTAWNRMFDGSSQITNLSEPFDQPTHEPRFGAQVRDFDHRRHLPDLSDRFAKRYSREILMALSAVEQAREDSGLDPRSNEVDAERVGILASSSRGPVEWWAQTLTQSTYHPAHEPIGVENAIFASLPGTPATLSAIQIGAQGFVSTISNACVGGHQAVGMAADLIASGQADAMIVLGHEAPLVPEVFQLYSSDGANVLAAPEGPPEAALKPYDVKRDGFVLGEGAVAVVLESERSARNRGAHTYARVLATTTINEAAHATRMDLTGASTAALVRGTALRSGVPLEEIDYFCGHGTGTRYNDLSESRALHRLYGESGAAPPLGSIKPIFGHLLGASGVLNCVASALMLDRQCLVPTANCLDVDPECTQDHVQEGPRQAPLRHAMSLSFAIGSQSSALLLEAA